MCQCRTRRVCWRSCVSLVQNKLHDQPLQQQSQNLMVKLGLWYCKVQYHDSRYRHISRKVCW